MVAVLNFQIPLFLGQLVNVVAALEPGKQLAFYAAQLVQPGTKLLGLYCVQVGCVRGMHARCQQVAICVCDPSPPTLHLPPHHVQSLGTLFYIYLLSVVGERLALRLRTHLFRCLIEQDISFFDDHKTGELVNR